MPCLHKPSNGLPYFDSLPEMIQMFAQQPRMGRVDGEVVKNPPPLEPQLTRHSEALADLVAVAETLTRPAGLLREHRSLSLARYAQRADAIGPEIDRLDLAAIEALLDRRVVSLMHAHAELEAFVHAHGAQNEEDLVRLIHGSSMRRLELLEGYPGPIDTRGLGSISSGLRHIAVVNETWTACARSDSRLR